MEYLQLANGISISKSAYATIVYYAIRDTEHTLLNKENHPELTVRRLSQIVNLDITDSGVIINLKLDLCYGIDLETVCKNVQENVIDVVTQSIGFEPMCVNIDVRRIIVC